FTATGTAGAPSAARSLVAADPGTISASGGASVATITVTANDEFGNPVSGVTVTLGASGTSNALTQPTGSTGASGQVTGTLSSTRGSAAGPNTLTATSGTLQGSPVTFRANGTASGATQIAINAGDGQSARVGTAVAVPPSVIVRDQFGNPVAGVGVTFAIGTG